MTLRCRLRTSLHCDQTLRALTATDRESHLPSTCRVQARSHFFLATLPHAAPTGLNREASLCPRLLSVEWEYGSGPGAAVHCTSLPSPDLALRTAQEADEILTSQGHPGGSVAEPGLGPKPPAPLKLSRNPLPPRCLEYLPPSVAAGRVPQVKENVCSFPPPPPPLPSACPPPLLALRKGSLGGGWSSSFCQGKAIHRAQRCPT